MEKHFLASQLNTSLEQISNFVVNTTKPGFHEVFIKDKWTISQHIVHLIKSMEAVNKAFKFPGFVLSYKFGTCNRDERNFEALKDKYESKLKALQVTTPSRYSSSSIPTESQSALMNELGRQTEIMQKHLKKRSDKALSKYILPHPLLGMLSLREMIAFSIIHMDHHRNVLANYLENNTEAQG